MMDSDIAVIGAGPYGLAAAAHLRAANLEVTVFGRVMDFWKNHMPAGMLLRSPWDASHIADPNQVLTLDSYHAGRPVKRTSPISLETFIDYGTWFQRQVAPDLDPRQILRIERDNQGFRLLLDDGQSFRCGRVIIATGIGGFAYRPETFDHIPCDLASHSSCHTDFKRFAGKEVAVVGRGQSALESAALLNEAGAHVEVIVRASKVRWLHTREILRHPWNPFARLFFHPTDVGPALLTQISARPHWFQLLPHSLQPGFAYRCIRPAGAAWLTPRMNGVKIATGQNIICAGETGGQVLLRLEDGTERRFDHVLLATGYRVNIHQHRFFPRSLKDSIRTIDGYPDLDNGFESSVAGLHFLGAPAALSFGPLMRFVSGTGYSAMMLARHIAASARHMPRFGRVHAA
jgi:thioredoxin reductase